MRKKIKLLKVTNLTIDSKSRVRIRRLPKNNSNDCHSCMYSTESGEVCTLPAQVEYKNGKCVYKKRKA